uniref:Uncharacterized protein n=1 Tax=Nelumbo nucifera TaxID=4432 RepID=A0A822YFD2_NELNU|nr:TPA_asm: hypothetical protein HUJ06_009983 [Nelumbo nucifera]
MTDRGLVIDTGSMETQIEVVRFGDSAYVDVGGGVLWEDVSNSAYGASSSDQKHFKRCISSFSMGLSPSIGHAHPKYLIGPGTFTEQSDHNGKGGSD